MHRHRHSDRHPSGRASLRKDLLVVDHEDDEVAARAVMRVGPPEKTTDAEGKPELSMELDVLGHVVIEKPKGPAEGRMT